MDDADASTDKSPQQTNTSINSIDISIYNPLNNNTSNSKNSSTDLKININNNKSDFHHTINQKHGLQPNLKINNHVLPESGMITYLTMTILRVSLT